MTTAESTNNAAMAVQGRDPIDLARRLPQRRSESLAETLQLAEQLALSGYFQDATSASQALVKILYGRELGIAPVTALMGVHIINGKPAPSAGLLASRIRSSRRYDYRIKRLDNEACVLEFRDGEQVVGESSFSQADANQAGANDGRNKHTWKSFPRNMLFARALSNGARWYTPDLFGGAVYTPEELGAPVDGEGNVIDVPFVPTRERDPADETDNDLETALSEWLVVAAQADALKIEHKDLPADSPATKIRRWTVALRERIDEAATIFGTPTEAEKTAPRDMNTGEILEDGDETAWERNRRLVKRAQELGLTGIPTLGNRSTTDVITEANATLAARIENAELDQQFSQEGPA